MSTFDTLIDPLEQADWLRDEERNASSCPACGSAAPVRLERAGCSDCTPFPTCINCGIWVGDGTGWLPGHEVIEWGGVDVCICTRCMNEVT